MAPCCCSSVRWSFPMHALDDMRELIGVCCIERARIRAVPPALSCGGSASGRTALRCAPLLGAADARRRHRPNPCQHPREFSSKRTRRCTARGRHCVGAHLRRRAAQWSEGQSAQRTGEKALRAGPFRAGSGVIAAALVERAAQRTLGRAEGGAAKPRRSAALATRSLRQASEAEPKSTKRDRPVTTIDSS
jgi:hypothetical protein